MKLRTKMTHLKTLYTSNQIVNNPVMSVWRSGNSANHSNKVQLRRTQLVLVLVTTCGWYTIPLFIQAHSAWPSLCEWCNK